MENFSQKISLWRFLWICWVRVFLFNLGDEFLYVGNFVLMDWRYLDVVAVFFYFGVCFFTLALSSLGVPLITCSLSVFCLISAFIKYLLSSCFVLFRCFFYSDCSVPVLFLCRLVVFMYFSFWKVFYYSIQTWKIYERNVKKWIKLVIFWTAGMPVMVKSGTDTCNISKILYSIREFFQL